MTKGAPVWLAIILISSFTQVAIAQDVITVPAGKNVVMIDGKCSPGEWDDANQVLLGDVARIYVKRSYDYVWMAVECLTCEMFALDFYVQPADGSLYDLHSSAKIGERKLQGGSWPEPWTWWNNDSWVANWSRVDSFEQRTFLPQKLREYQISRRRFTGDTWRVMFGLQLLAEPEWQTFVFPQGAKADSSQRWMAFKFKDSDIQEREAGVAMPGMVCAGSLLGQQHLPTTRLDTDGFRSLMQTVADGWNRGDAKMAASCFAKDAVYSSPPAPTHRGRKGLYDYFGGDKGRELPMHMTWHHLVFDPAQQIGMGEYTFRYRIQTHGIAIVKISDGLIRNWREYEVESPLDWEQFVGENRF